MSGEDWTVAQLLGLSKHTFKTRAADLSKSPGFDGVRKALAGKPDLVVDVAPATTWSSLESVLDIPLCNIVGWAWNTRRALLKYCDPARYAPQDTVHHTLLEQEIDWGRKPVIRLYLGDTQLGEVEFTAKVTLAIDGGMLEIKNGRIMGGRIGKCRGKASLLCEKAVLLDPETRSFDFPPFTLGEGYAIKAA